MKLFSLYFGSLLAVVLFSSDGKDRFFSTQRQDTFFGVSRLLVSGSFLEERVVHQCSATSR